MPVLDASQVRELLERARVKCGAKDYCRTCDEFYRLDDPHAAIHDGHRKTIVPFVEVRK